MSHAGQILNELYFLPSEKLVQSGLMRSVYNDRKCSKCQRVFRKVFALSRHLQQAHGMVSHQLFGSSINKMELPNVRVSTRSYTKAYMATRKRLTLEDLEPEEDDNWIPGRKKARTMVTSTPKCSMSLRPSRSRASRAHFQHTEGEDDDVVEVDAGDVVKVSWEAVMSSLKVPVVRLERLTEEFIRNKTVDMDEKSGTDMEYDIIEESSCQTSPADLTSDSGQGTTIEDRESLTVDCDPPVMGDDDENYPARVNIVNLESDNEDTASVRSLASSNSMSDESVVEIPSSFTEYLSTPLAAMVSSLKVAVVRLERIALPDSSPNGTYFVGNLVPQKTPMKTITLIPLPSVAKKPMLGKIAADAKEIPTMSCHDTVLNFLASADDEDDDSDIVEIFPQRKEIKDRMSELLHGLIYDAVKRVQSKIAQVEIRAIVVELVSKSVQRVDDSKATALQKAQTADLTTGFCHNSRPQMPFASREDLLGCLLGDP